MGATEIERLIAMAERLVVALESDIAALKAGTPSRDDKHDSGHPAPIGTL